MRRNSGFSWAEYPKFVVCNDFSWWNDFLRVLGFETCFFGSKFLLINCHKFPH